MMRASRHHNLRLEVKSNRQDRTGPLGRSSHKRLPNIGIPEQSIKFANSLC